ncbi:hypothetical protein ASPZODRAFT_150606 [Penicilliopsis zonata CBS 506.65]|uniref:AB hydrolase-1 domain-containing protein n=1 Tax=Penicilliopsis zonata CBS 506.65 TaxID=1073090 RepID=A0A1L9SM59_9EURO|nr:hypothetical protein ASPZODRAFT_150606 [Penicilliopsis zonata CBS 506.65]OJJ48362.1 hypothetical protein ASPZODRAFT_150606 [Penicilliopsis zonata CBS 506.65]
MSLDDHLPPAVSSRTVVTSDLTFHLLEAGFSPGHDRPLILLLHGFPELAFSWRRVLPLLAAQGYHAVAPDQRGFGRTTGWDTRSFDFVDLASFSLTTLVRDCVLLVHALGYRAVRCVVGHDCGAVPASLCALIRPDLFHSLVLLSHPFNGSPLPETSKKEDNENNENYNNRNDGSSGVESAAGDVRVALRRLGKKHYKWYNSTPAANQDMTNPPEGLHVFLRNYFHLKSGSWAGNNPHPLQKWSADSLLHLPAYYIMPVEATMPAAVRAEMDALSAQEQARSHVWLPDSELAVYAAEYARTGFQGGLNWYRVRTATRGQHTRDFDLFAGKKIEVPCAYVSGRLDWGTYQEPRALEKMLDGSVCLDFRRAVLLDGVGHWAPQECPVEVANVIIDIASCRENK